MASKVVTQNDIIDIIKATISIMDGITGVISNVLNISNHLKMSVTSFNYALDTVFGPNGEGGIVGRVREINDNIAKQGLRNRMGIDRLVNKLLILQFEEIKMVIELIVNIADEASRIDDKEVDLIYHIVDKTLGIFNLIKSFPINPILSIRLEMSRVFLYRLLPCVLRPIRVIGAYFVKSAKGISYGILSLTFINEVVSPLLLKLVSDINSLGITKYITANVILRIIENSIVKIYDIFRYIAKRNFNHEKLIWKVTIAMSLINIIVRSIADLIERVPILKTLITIDLDVWNAVLVCIKSIFKIIRVISRHKFDKAKLFGVVVNMKLITSIFKSLCKIMEDVDTIKTLIDFELKTWDKVLASTKKIFEILSEISSHRYKFSSLVRITILLSFMVMIFKMLFEIMKSKDIMATFISSKLKIWDKILGGTQKVFEILSEISSHKYKIKTLINMVIMMGFMVAIFKMLQIVLKYALYSGLISIAFNIVGLSLLLTFEILLLVVKALKSMYKAITKKVALGILKVLAILSLLGLVALSLFAVSLVAIPVMLNILPIVGFMLFLIPLMLTLLAISLLAVAFALISPFAISGLFGLTLCVTAVGIMAAQLYLISQIDLDKEKTMEVVDTVLSVCRAIINRVFGRAETDRFDVEDTGSWLDLAKALFTGAPEILNALAASFILIVSIVSVMSIIFIAGILKLMEKVIGELDRSAILEAVDKVINICRFIKSAIFGNKTYDENTKQIVKTDEGERNFLVRFISGITDIFSAVLGSAILVSSLISVAALMFIADVFKSLENLTVDESKIALVVSKIINGVKSILTAVRTPAPADENQDKDGILAKAARAVLPTTVVDAIDMFLSMPMLLSAWIVTGLLKQIVEGLQVINTLPKLDNIEANVKVMMGHIKNINTVIKDEDVKVGKSNIKNLRKFKRMMKVLISIGELDYSKIEKSLSIFDKDNGPMSKLIDSLYNFCKDHITKFAKFKDLKKSETNVKYVIKLITETYKNLNSINDNSLAADLIDWGPTGPMQLCLTGVEAIVKRLQDEHLSKGQIRRAKKRLSGYEELLQIMTEMVHFNLDEFRSRKLDDYERFMNKHIEFLDSVNKMDVNKVETVAELFKNMAKFSKTIHGNFDKLADALNEKIAPLMEELKELLEQVPKKIEESSANISASTYAAANPSTSLSDVEAQAQRENPHATQEQIAEIAQQRLVEQLRQQNNAIVSKVEEITALLKYGQAKVKTV